MSRLLPAAALLWILALAPPPLNAEEKAGKDGVFGPLFDGKTLEGWSGNEKFWFVKEWFSLTVLIIPNSRRFGRW